jgi:aromatic ring-opening dioxygenase catalytic subunit (LigB family)
MPILGDPTQAEITKSLRTRVPRILKLGTPEEPRAIVLVTAHWNTNTVTVSSGAKHELYYDYYGFPNEAYNLKYDAPGSPEVAGLVEKALKEEGIPVKLDAKRGNDSSTRDPIPLWETRWLTVVPGWDHGVFVPMMLIHPTATIPIVQVSVLDSEDPKEHFAYGRALSKLRAQNIAIVGSGFASMHNLRLLFSGITKQPDFKALNTEWSEQVTDAATAEDVEERGKKFEGWRGWKGSFDMHPRGGADHFLPLIVCAGAAGEAKAKTFADEFVGLDILSYYWE